MLASSASFLPSPLQVVRVANDALAKLRPVVLEVASRVARRVPRGVALAVHEELAAAGMAAAFVVLREGRVKPEEEGFGPYLQVRLRGAMLDELRLRDAMPRRARRRAREAGEMGTLVSIEEVTGARDVMTMSTAASEGPLERAEAASTRDLVLRAVATLPDRERLIITMHYLEGVRFREIGALLGVSEPRISQLHSRAMDSLREQLGMEPADASSASGIRLRAAVDANTLDEARREPA